MSDAPTAARDQLLHLAAADIRAAAAKDLAEGHDPRERVVLALDTRDQLGAEWGAMLSTEPGRFDVFLKRRVEQLGAVGRFTEEQDAAGHVPMIFAGAPRSAIVDALDSAGVHSAAAALASIDRAVVVCVSAGGITVRPLAA